MKRLLLLVPVYLLLLGGVARAEHPAPTGFVVDAAGVLSAPMRARVEAELRDYSRRTTNQVAVAVVQSLEGETVEDYARSLFNEWGVGTKAKNNGVLLLIAIDDRQDRIQVGYGLEKVLTDQVAQGVLDDVVTPAAAQESWSTAVLGGERAIRAALHDPHSAAAVAGTRAGATSPFGGGQAQDAAPVDAPAVDAPFDPGAVPQLVDPQVRDGGGFPFGFAAFGVAILAFFGAAVSSQRRRRLRGGGLPVSGVAAGAVLYEQERHRHDSSGPFDGGAGGMGGGMTGGGGAGFGGGSSGGGGASGSW